MSKSSNMILGICMKKFIIIAVFIIFPFFTVIFQNCTSTEFSTGSSASTGESRFGESGAAPPPNVAQSETCTKGDKLALWSDKNHDGKKDFLLGYIVSYKGSETAANNYNYYSASAHPKIGPQPKPFASHVFFYNGPEGLSLNFFHNIDDGGSADNSVFWDIYVKDNNFSDQLLLSDDPGEVKTHSRSANSTYYKAYVRYWKNTDGAVIGPLTNKSFEIKVNVVGGNGDLKNSAFYSANGDIYSLSNQHGLESFIITYDSVEDCD